MIIYTRALYGNLEVKLTILRYNARAYIIMRASYDRIDNKQNMCGKVKFSTSLNS